MLVVQLSERLFLLVKGEFCERFDNGTHCNLSCHFDNLTLLGGSLIVAYYAVSICWPNSKLSQYLA